MSLKPVSVSVFGVAGIRQCLISIEPKATARSQGNRVTHWRLSNPQKGRCCLSHMLAGEEQSYGQVRI